MLVSFYFNKLHILVILYVIVEFSKRIIKEQLNSTKTKKNKELTANNVRNVQMFTSHMLIFILYFIEKKQKNIIEDKPKDERNSEYRIILLKNKMNAEKIQSQKNKEKYENVWILIIVCSLLNIISYFPIDTIYEKIKVNGNNSIGFYIIILLFCEKVLIKSQYSIHHYLSTIILLFSSVLSLMNAKIKNDEKNKNKIKELYSYEKLCIHLIIYCLYHYCTQSFYFNLFYYINENYYTSLYFISGFQGLFSTIITLFMEFYIYFPPGKSIFHVMKTTYEEYTEDLFWNSLVFICMGIQNILTVLTLAFFKPSINGIITATFPILEFLKNCLRESTSNAFNWIDYSNYVILIISVLIYSELIVLNFWGLNKGAREKIIERGKMEMISDELNILDSSFNINSPSINSSSLTINP